MKTSVIRGVSAGLGIGMIILKDLIADEQIATPQPLHILSWLMIFQILILYEALRVL